MEDDDHPHPSSSPNSMARASISELERARLGKIYRDFVVGRKGEMKKREGSQRWVGGRA